VFWVQAARRHELLAFTALFFESFYIYSAATSFIQRREKGTCVDGGGALSRVRIQTALVLRFNALSVKWNGKKKYLRDAFGGEAAYSSGG